MTAKPEEKLDDVIADLIDDDSENTPDSTFEGIETTSQDFGADPVSLTGRAADQIRKIKEEERLDDDLYLRVAVEGGGCSGLSYKLGFDHKTEEDSLVKSQNIDIVVDPRHMMYLEGISIDYPDGLDARGFTFNNPNASETCGCGSSFAT